jgi:hypothetical protein
MRIIRQSLGSPGAIGSTEGMVSATLMRRTVAGSTCSKSGYQYVHVRLPVLHQSRLIHRVPRVVFGDQAGAVCCDGGPSSRRVLDGLRLPVEPVQEALSWGQEEEFFLKKEPKTFSGALAVSGPDDRVRRRQIKSFLFLFSKKKTFLTF